MKSRTSDDADVLGAAPLVRKFAPKIASAAEGKAILDVGCGSDRNAVILSRLGCTVICLDKDLTALHAMQSRLRCSPLRNAAAELIAQQVDFTQDRWPFTPTSVGGIISVHFLLPALFPNFASSLCSGGYLLLQTVPGCGGNYLELPKAGELRSALEKDFDFDFYRERAAGPAGHDAVTVQAVARRRRPVAVQSV